MVPRWVKGWCAWIQMEPTRRHSGLKCLAVCANFHEEACKIGGGQLVPCGQSTNSCLASLKRGHNNDQFSENKLDLSISCLVFVDETGQSPRNWSSERSHLQNQPVKIQCSNKFSHLQKWPTQLQLIYRAFHLRLWQKPQWTTFIIPANQEKGFPPACL